MKLIFFIITITIFTGMLWVLLVVCNVSDKYTIIIMVLAGIIKVVSYIEGYLKGCKHE